MLHLLKFQKHFKRGRSIRLSPQRRFVCDLLHFAKKVPALPMQRTMALADVIDARKNAGTNISWLAIFLKAYSIVSMRFQELRRAYINFPWAHLYEHPENVASFTLEREYKGENGVFFARVIQPELKSLEELTEIIRFHKTADIDSIESYRLAMILGRLPKLLSRLVWWLALETSAPKRAYHFGTFSISTTASIGGASLYLTSPLTTALNYGVFKDDGSLDVRITYDHRVVDGAVMARAIVELENVLLNEIREELLTIGQAEAVPEVSMRIA